MKQSFAPTILHLSAVEYTAVNLLGPQLSELQDRGFNVRVGCQPGPNGFDESLLPFRPIEVGFPRRIDLLAMAQASRQVVRILNEVRPSAVHLHTPAVALPFRMIPKRFLPTDMKVFYTVHGFAHHWDTGTMKDFILEKAERRLAPRTSVLFFQSKEDLHNARLRDYKSKLKYLGNGVGKEWFDLPLKSPRRDSLRMIFVGRLVREKGILDLLEALAMVPKVELTIVGEQHSSERDGVGDEVSRLASQNGLAGRVHCIGKLSQSELREKMRSIDVVVLPSYREGVPRSLIEGLAAGRPLLATDTRGCRELVREGLNGFLVPVGRPDLLAQALRKFEALPQSELMAMGTASKKIASADHREQVTFERLIDAYLDEGLVPEVTMR